LTCGGRGYLRWRRVSDELMDRLTAAGDDHAKCAAV